MNAEHFWLESAISSHMEFVFGMKESERADCKIKNDGIIISPKRTTEDCHDLGARCSEMINRKWKITIKEIK